MIIKDTIENLTDSNFKDASPIDTIEKIKSILKSYNIQTEEIWGETGVPYCFSLRVSVKGTTFGTNGKGLTKEFALASGYGELMERLQLGYLGKLEMQKDGNYSANAPISERVSAEELFEKNKKWYELYSERLRIFTGEEIDPKKIIMRYSNYDGNVLAIPFYCINKKSREYLPTGLVGNIYTANGCAAGNSPEETIVQALSEIVERYNLTMLMFDDVTPPDIPEEVIKKYKVAYSIISFLRENDFKVIVKDCSFGEKFPVISICIIDTHTGKYHTHFAANPVFEIALERALTESFQGSNIREISKFVDFRFKTEGFFDIKNLISELTVGVSEKLPGFFVGKSKYQYNEKVGFSGENNKELLKECIEYFSAKGFDILIRDSSCLGFVTYQIIIPGYSEVFAHRFSEKNNDLQYKNKVMKTLRNPSLAGIDEKIGCFMGLAQGNKGFASETRLHAHLSPKEDMFFMAATLAYLNFEFKKYHEVLKNIKTMLSAKITQNEELLICINRYLSLLTNKYDSEKIKDILYFFHKKDSVDYLISCIEANKNPLDEFTLHCDLQCKEDCPLIGKCCNKRTNEIAEIIYQKMEELDFNKFVKTIEKITE